MSTKTWELERSELEAVEQSAIIRGESIKVSQPKKEAKAVDRIAQSQGISREELHTTADRSAAEWAQIEAQRVSISRQPAISA